MASKAEDYRARAAKASAWLNAIRDPTLKAQYLELARQWRGLAEQAEQDEALSRRDAC
jgi:hypothetical protein